MRWAGHSWIESHHTAKGEKRHLSDLTGERSFKTNGHRWKVLTGTKTARKGPFQFLHLEGLICWKLQIIQRPVHRQLTQHDQLRNP